MACEDKRQQDQILSEGKKKLLYYEGGQPLRQVAPRVCGVSITRNTQNSTEHSPGQPDVDEAALRRIELVNLQSYFQSQLFCDSLNSLLVMWQHKAVQDREERDPIKGTELGRNRAGLRHTVP